MDGERKKEGQGREGRITERLGKVGKGEGSQGAGGVGQGGELNWTGGGQEKGGLEGRQEKVWRVVQLKGGEGREQGGWEKGRELNWMGGTGQGKSTELPKLYSPRSRTESNSILPDPEP